jgi:hypothetical protein
VKKLVMGAAALAVACAVARQILPDIQRYLRMRSM